MARDCCRILSVRGIGLSTSFHFNECEFLPGVALPGFTIGSAQNLSGFQWRHRAQNELFYGGSSDGVCLRKVSLLGRRSFTTIWLSAGFGLPRTGRYATPSVGLVRFFPLQLVSFRSIITWASIGKYY